MSEIDCTNTRDADVRLILHNFHLSRESYHKSITIQGSTDYYNPMQVLSNGSFGKLAANELSILFTRLTKIEEAAFSLPMEEKLHTLIITRTYLEDTTSFKGIARLRHLQILSLSHNRLRHVPSYAFSPGQVALKWINLRGNKIESIDTHAFTGLSGLELLIVSENKLTLMGSNVFGSLKRMNKLQLVLDSNRLTTDSFAENPFNKKDGIKMLSLRKNQLSEVPEQLRPILEGGGVIDMQDNRLICSCASFWLLRDQHSTNRCHNCLCDSGQDIWTFFSFRRNKHNCSQAMGQ